MGWCKSPFFFPKPCCPGDGACPWTLLRFHYKSMPKWTRLTFITRTWIYFVLSPPVVTASNSSHGSGAAWHAGKEVAAIIFTSFSLPEDNSLLPQHPSLNCIFHLPQAETQVYTHCHPSRVAMPLPCFPLWWAPWHFAIDLHGHRTRNPVEVTAFVI